MPETKAAALIEAGRGAIRKLHARALTSSWGLIAALILLVAVALCSFLSWQQYLKAADLTRQTNQTISALNRLIATMLTAETSQRGYLLTRDERYLADYTHSAQIGKMSLSELLSSPTDAIDQALVSRMATKVSEKLSELTLTVGLTRSGNAAEALRIVRSNRGLRLMEEIRAVAQDYDALLQRRLRTTREESRFYARLSQWVSTLGCAGIFLIVFFANRSNVRLISTITQLNTELTHVNGELQQFVYSASHDLQEPLRMVSIYSELASKKAASGRSSERDLGYVKDAAKHMIQIVDDLLIYTRAMSDHEPPGPEQADMNEAVENICRMFGPTIEETRATVVYGNLPVLPISQMHAGILLQNLLGNALKYRSEAEPPRIVIEIVRDRDCWDLSVSDNGIGIDPKYHGRIFGLFKRLHSREQYQGTGLGLAICKKIAERYHGKIAVRSEIGHGSTFTVTIPAEPRNAVAVAS